MRKHAHLSAMVGFGGQHVAEHLHASRPWSRPSVSQELLHATLSATERFREHCSATGGAFR